MPAEPGAVGQASRLSLICVPLKREMIIETGATPVLHVIKPRTHERAGIGK